MQEIAALSEADAEMAAPELEARAQIGVICEYSMCEPSGDRSRTRRTVFDHVCPSQRHEKRTGEEVRLWYDVTRASTDQPPRLQRHEKNSPPPQRSMRNCRCDGGAVRRHRNSFDIGAHAPIACQVSWVLLEAGSMSSRVMGWMFAQGVESASRT